MMRRASLSTLVASVGLLNSTQKRSKWYSKQEAVSTMPDGKPNSPGSLNFNADVCPDPDADVEYKLPPYRNEMIPDPKKKFNNRIARDYRFGVYSFQKWKPMRGDPGPFHTANQAGHYLSFWQNIGDMALLNIWSGVLRVTFGTGVNNERAKRYLGRALARKDKASGAIVKDYEMEDKKPYDLVVFPHTKEHQQHRRYKNPPLKGQKDIEPIQGKRLQRELQYHVGQGIRTTLVDGYFGSHPDSCTSMRFIGDNLLHAYFANIAFVRNRNLVEKQETALANKQHRSPLDEYAWRRQSVLMYHGPGFQHELPRIVEEFGGPRPQDYGLTEREKFVAMDPYSIPMKSYIGGVPDVLSGIIKPMAFLCARWGYYADDKELLTVAGDASVDTNTGKATVLVHASNVDTDALRASNNTLWGAHHFRLSAEHGVVSRGWNFTTIDAKKNKPERFDIVEESEGLIQRPLATRMGKRTADGYHEHRYTGVRNTYAWGPKNAHNHGVTDPKYKAAAGGHTFAKASTAEGGLARPSAINLSQTSVVIVTKSGGAKKKATPEEAAKAVIASLTEDNLLYAEAEKLEATFVKALGMCEGLFTVGEKEAGTVVKNMATKGTA